MFIFMLFRLSALGFMTHAALHNHTANYGLQDQVAALKWINKNIYNFAGDPKRVS